MGAGGRSWPLGMLARAPWSTRSLELSTVELALLLSVSYHPSENIQNQRNLQADVTLGGLARDELLPSVGALADNVKSVP